MDSKEPIEEVASCWVEVDLEAVTHNLREIKALVGEAVEVAAVVKANAYGHGLVETSRALVEAGADRLAVSTLEEGSALRAAGIAAPILVLGHLLPAQAPRAVKLQLTATVADFELTRALSNAAQKADATARVHVKVDTGMGRYGVLPGEAAALVERIRALPGVEVEGIYTHLATAMEKDKSKALRQFQRFRQVLADLETRGIVIPIKHAANSAALIDLPQTRLDMVRTGTLLYGQFPSRWVSRSLKLLPTWQYKTRICFAKSVPKGWSVGYGSDYITRRPTRIGVIPVGYATGISVEPASVLLGWRGIRKSLLRILGRHRSKVRVREQFVPVIGRIAGQSCCIDLTDLPSDAQIGEEVTLSARRVLVPAEVVRVYRK